MTILAQYKNQNVEILEVYETGGVKMAAVRAITGRPFVGGDKWPVYTEWTTAPAAELSNVHTDPQPEPTQPNLLSMVLSYQERAQWASGEAVTLITSKTGRPLAWLKNNYETIWLLAKGAKKALPVYRLTRNGWELVPNIGADYHQWAEKAQANR